MTNGAKVDISQGFLPILVVVALVIGMGGMTWQMGRHVSRIDVLVEQVRALEALVQTQLHDIDRRLTRIETQVTP